MLLLMRSRHLLQNSLTAKASINGLAPIHLFGLEEWWTLATSNEHVREFGLIRRILMRKSIGDGSLYLPEWLELGVQGFKEFLEMFIVSLRVRLLPSLAAGACAELETEQLELLWTISPRV